MPSAPKSTWDQVQSTNFGSASVTPAHFAMSVSPPLSRKLASESYSIWPRSGALSALSALDRFWYVPAFPDGVVLSVTWMSGFSPFQTSTAFCMPGTQDQ